VITANCNVQTIFYNSVAAAKNHEINGLNGLSSITKFHQKSVMQWHQWQWHHYSCRLGISLNSDLASMHECL